MLKLIFFFSFIFVTTANESLAQEKVLKIISGQVKDIETGLPVGSVNVFLSNTTIGASTDSNGTFNITNIPSGIYDLVISRVGYQREIKITDLISADSLFYGIKLTPRIIQTTEFEITADRPIEWKEDLDRFKKVFIGKSKFAEKCDIHNSEVIDFRTNNDTLIAQTDSILYIENKALGYQIYIILKEFVWNVKEDYGHYLIYTFFKPMEASNAKEQSEWARNREKAYLGSFNHFLYTLLHQSSEKNMFRISSGPLKKLVNGGGHYVNPEDFDIKPIEGTPLHSLYFDGYIRIDYGKKADNEFSRGGQDSRGLPVGGIVKVDLSSASFLNMRSPCAYIDTLGNLFNPLAFEISGRWADKRVAELVPMY